MLLNIITSAHLLLSGKYINSSWYNYKLQNVLSKLGAFFEASKLCSESWSVCNGL